MKKSIALCLTVFYLIFSLGSLRAEASLLENKEMQENIFSVKQSEESSVSHFAESPSREKQVSPTFDRNLIPEVHIQSRPTSATVPLFVRNCNFRR